LLALEHIARRQDMRLQSGAARLDTSDDQIGRSEPLVGTQFGVAIHALFENDGESVEIFEPVITLTSAHAQDDFRTVGLANLDRIRVGRHTPGSRYGDQYHTPRHPLGD
jgi:hypothetical protein